jgi:predicted dehydrogenase
MAQAADVMVVGLGNIGFRHVQGLAPVAARIRLWGCDPDSTARARASAEWERLGGIAGGFVESTADAPDAFACIILATAARGRLRLLAAVLSQLAGTTAVVEKVTFTAMSDFARAKALLADAGRQGVVNHARRLWPLHQVLRERLGGRRFTLSVRGRDIGLGCNGLHFIDLLQFLSGEAAVSLQDWQGGAVMPAKRDGYWESHGRLRLATPGGSLLDLSVQADDPAVTTMHLAWEGGGFDIEEMPGAVHGEGGWQAGRAPYQSELTGAVVAAVLEGRPTGLPALAESEAAHAVLLDVLGRHFAAAGIDVAAGVPIT